MFPILKWQPLTARNNYSRALLVYKCINDMAPTYLSRRLQFVSETHNVNTRQAASDKLALPPKSNGKDTEYFRNSFTFKGITQWNLLDSGIRHANSVQCFKERYKSLYNN